MIDYTQAGAELAAKLSNAETHIDVMWYFTDFTANVGSNEAMRAFGKFCAQVLEGRAAPPGVRTPASDQAAVDMLNPMSPCDWKIEDVNNQGFLSLLSKQIAANHVLRRDVSVRDERIAELEAGMKEIDRLADTSLNLIAELQPGGGHGSRTLAIRVVVASLMPAKVDPFPALTALITYHETGGLEGSGSAETLKAARIELGKAQSC